METEVKRYDILNYIIKKYNYKSYLEIGTQAFINFNEINIENKECVDPMDEVYGKYTYNMYSDDAFIEIKKNNKKYDIIFIDGLHHSEQVTRDINNSLDVLNKNGMILLHDCNPRTALEACYPINGKEGAWNGDCYKSFIKFKMENKNIFTTVVDTDCGVGIIIPDKINNLYQDIDIIELTPNENDILTGGTIIIDNKILTWDFFDKNRSNLLSLITTDYFYKNI
jgi:hypothetical protein